MKIKLYKINFAILLLKLFIYVRFAACFIGNKDMYYANVWDIPQNLIINSSFREFLILQMSERMF